MSDLAKLWRYSPPETTPQTKQIQGRYALSNAELQIAGSSTASGTIYGVGDVTYFSFPIVSSSSSRHTNARGDATLAAARDVYLWAYEDLTHNKPAAEITEVKIEQDHVWRMTLFVTPELFADVAKLVDLESALHKKVEAISPDLAGYFSILFETDDHA